MQAPNPRTTSLFGLCSYTSSLVFDFETPFKGLRSALDVDLVAATMFYLCLIIDLAPVDSCVVRRHNTS